LRPRPGALLRLAGRWAAALAAGGGVRSAAAGGERRLARAPLARRRATGPVRRYRPGARGLRQHGCAGAQARRLARGKRRVQPGHLVLRLDPQANRDVQQLEDDPGDHGRPDPGGRYGYELSDELARIAIEQAVGATTVDRHGREQTGRQRAPGSADAVDTPDVERVVDTPHVLDPDDRPVADDAGPKADQDRARGNHVARN